MKEEEKLDKEKKEVGMKKERVYHSHCLTCSYCTNTIQGKFYTQSGKIVCGGCAATQVNKIRPDHNIHNVNSGLIENLEIL